MTEQTSTFDVTEFKNPDETKKEESPDIVEKVPERVFIVPYRDREPHKLVFSRVMPYILGDSNYRILFVHQKDTRPFNRGGIKNIGFHYVKKKWPNDWKNITLIFHDIDFIKSLIIFFDGIPSYSKILEQRRRRCKNYFESKIRRKLFKENFDNMRNDIISEDGLVYNYFDW